MESQSLKIEVLLATYQGQRFLSELLNSLLDQTYHNWILSVSDDGSSDDTLKILENFAIKNPDKVKFIEQGPNQGPCNNFVNLMEKSTEDIVAFCDQDDIWKPDKLEVMINDYLKNLSEVESKPFLAICDAMIVDDKLNVINKSMLHNYKKPIKQRILYSHLQYNNCITGCCLLANRAAIDLAIKEKNNLKTKFNANIVMHDHWLGLVTAYYKGLIIFIDKKLVLYRQHDSNVIGVNKRLFINILRLNNIKNFFAKYNMLKLYNPNQSLIGYLIRHTLHSLNIK